MSKVFKTGTSYSTVEIPKASATVIPADSFVTLSSGLAIVAVAGSAKLAYTKAGAGAGETVVSVIRDNDVLIKAVADANLAAANRGAEVDLVIAPAVLTTGLVTETTPATWAAVTDGSLRISIDGTAYNVDAIDFTGDTTMALVAATIQAAVRTATSALETVTWDSTNSQFVFSSVAATASSAITVLSTSTGTVGTDVTGASRLNGQAGTGLVVDYYQKVDVGASATDVFLVDAGNNGPEMEGDTDVVVKINKHILG